VTTNLKTSASEDGFVIDELLELYEPMARSRTVKL
jgi:hypothetical protein